MKKDIKPPPPPQQRWQGYALLAAVLIAAGFELTSYVTYAARDGGIPAVMVASIIWLGLMALPWKGWLSAPLRALCVVLGLFASISNLTAGFGATMGGRVAGAERHADAKDAAERARRTLDGINETGAAAELEAAVLTARAAHESAAKADTARMGGKESCFKDCRQMRDALLLAQDRLGKAKARDEAKRELADAERQRDAAPKQDANALAASIAPYVGADANELAHGFIVWFCVAGVIVATGMATMGQQALRMIGKRPSTGQNPKGGRTAPVQSAGQTAKIIPIRTAINKKLAAQEKAEKMAKNEWIESEITRLLSAGKGGNEIHRIMNAGGHVASLSKVKRAICKIRQNGPVQKAARK